MRENLLEELKENGPPPKDPKELRRWLIRPFTYSSYWLSSLYVIIEGWKELSLKDRRINLLLNNKRHIQKLKRYRNGTFHFQKTYFDNRFTDFFNEKSKIINWAKNLHYAFGAYFIRYNFSKMDEKQLKLLIEELSSKGL